MSYTGTTKLSDVLDNLAPAGSNDARWFLAEHQLVQAKMSIQIAHATLIEISEYPESLEDGDMARDCSYLVKSAYVDFLAQYTSFLSYIADSDVVGRAGKEEK